MALIMSVGRSLGGPCSKRTTDTRVQTSVAHSVLCDGWTREGDAICQPLSHSHSLPLLLIVLLRRA